MERRAFDYSDLEAWMAHADQVIRSTRHALDGLVPDSVRWRPDKAPGTCTVDQIEQNDKTLALFD